LRNTLRPQLDPQGLDGIVSMHLIENDPALSKPITDNPGVSDPGSGDWFVLIDATHVDAIVPVAARISGDPVVKPLLISNGVYVLMWDLARSDISGA
jgi:hypothetical protein